MFSADPRMAVSQESDGTIRVVESGVQTDILRVRINHVAFDMITDPGEALSVIVSSPEVQSFMQVHGIGQLYDNVHVAGPVYGIPELKTTPRPGVRSISGELNDVTLADALDYVLKTFPGFWLYQDCESSVGQRLVYFDLFPVPGRMWVWDGHTLAR